MPYVNDRVCFICGRINADGYDLDSMEQITGPKGQVANCCIKHHGVIEESKHQNSTIETRKKYAARTMNTKSFKNDMKRCLLEMSKNLLTE